MFKKILVALDSSLVAKDVFQEALYLAQKTGASLMLVHVLSHEEEGSPNLPSFGVADYAAPIMGEVLEVYRHAWEAYEQKHKAILTAWVDEATKVGVQAEFTQNQGSPGRTICSLAHTWGADLIVMGRRGTSSLTELFLGSASNYVLHHASCSVLVLKNPVVQTAVQPDQEKQMASVSS